MLPSAESNVFDDIIYVSNTYQYVNFYVISNVKYQGNSFHKL